jgi:hypothetical protein
VRALLAPVMLVIMLQSNPVLSQNQQVNILWFEDASCAAWAKSAGNKAIRAIYEAWIRGFVSGHNYANPSRQVALGKFPDSSSLHQQLDQYCSENPKSSFIGGAIAILETLRAPASTVPAKKSPAKTDPSAAPKK